MSKYVLGLDIGTSACKSILVDDSGHVVAKQVGSYPFNTPKPGWVNRAGRVVVGLCGHNNNCWKATGLAIGDCCDGLSAQMTDWWL